MRLRVKVLADALHVRTGPSISYRIVGMNYYGHTMIVDDEVKYSSGERWYHIEGTSNWSCAFSAVYWDLYLQIIEDLDPPKPPAPPPPPPPPPPPQPIVDYDKLQRELNSHGNKGKLAPYDTKYVTSFGTKGTPRFDNIYINKVYEPGEINLNKQGTQELLTDSTFIESNLWATKYNVNANIFANGDDLNDKLFESVNRYKVHYPDYDLTRAKTHIFFTRPDLNLLHNPNTLLNSSHTSTGLPENMLQSDIAGDPFFSYVFARNPNIIRNLTQNNSLTSKHPFNLFLGNTAQSFEVADEAIKTEEVGENFVGYKVSYGKNNHGSLTAGSFTVNYTDDRNLTIYNTHKVWVEYISQIFKGQIRPKEDYIQNRIIDYACSVYYFVTAENDEDIIFGHKYTGVYPTNVPASDMSWTKGSLLNFPETSITYEYWFRETISMVMLAEFNELTKELPRQYVPTFDKNIGTPGSTWTQPPYIEAYRQPDGRTAFKLRYRPDATKNGSGSNGSGGGSTVM